MRRLVLLLPLTFALALDALALDAPAGDPRTPLVRPDGGRLEDLLPPEACKSCHPQHFEEWRGSMHAYAISDPVFHAMHALGQKETGDQLGDFCVRCHSPVGAATGEVDASTRSERGLSDLALASISCEVCHRSVRLEGGHPHNASFTIDPKGALVGGIPDPVPNSFHASKTDESLANPDFCGSCHNVVNHHGVPVEKPHDEYVDSLFPDRNIGCIDCHMQTYTGRATPDGPLRHQLHRHNFVGVDVALTPFPRRGFQRREVEAFLKTAARVTLDLPDRVEAGKEFSFDVAVKNVGAGHNLPTGPSTAREMWIDVSLLREDGVPILRSGDLDDNGDLMGSHSDLRPNADPQLALFSDHFEDQDGKEVFFMWQARRLVEGTIPPLTTRVATYRARAPVDAIGEKLQLRVRLRFRPFPPHQLRRLGIGELAKELPIFDMQELESDRIEVVETLQIPDVVRVPEDAPDIGTALAQASEGDTVLVAPGRWLLDRPLDFGGRAIELRSVAGAEETSLELVGPGRDTRSIVVFRDGETRSTSIEGFTLRGGRGTIVDELRAGGAIVCLGSSPSLVANVFVDNQAEDGLGGAVFLRDSGALLLDNRFESNRAGIAGGAVCATGSSHVLIEGNTLSENRAAEGGALAIIEGCQILGNDLHANRAFRGGAIVVRASATGRSAIRSNVLRGNTAVRGGAVYLDGTTHTRLDRNTLAGNIGGAVYVAGAADVVISHATIVDNRTGRAVVDVQQDARTLIVNSIVWGNRPALVGANLRWSNTDDARHVDGGGPTATRTNTSLFPLFRPPFSKWERCRSEEPGCVPILRENATSLEPTSPRLLRRYRPGRLELLETSPCVDAGDPEFPPDADGTRADLGAIARLQAGKLFVRGDVDGDGGVSAADALALTRALDRRERFACAEAADVDANGHVTPADAARLLAFLQGASGALEAPFPDCGADPQLLSSAGCFEERCKP